jgi:hypothetical protein
MCNNPSDGHQPTAGPSARRIKPFACLTTLASTPTTPREPARKWLPVQEAVAFGEVTRSAGDLAVMAASAR